MYSGIRMTCFMLTVIHICQRNFYTNISMYIYNSVFSLSLSLSLSHTHTHTNIYICIYIYIYIYTHAIESIIIGIFVMYGIIPKVLTFFDSTSIIPMYVRVSMYISMYVCMCVLIWIVLSNYSAMNFLKNP